MQPKSVIIFMFSFFAFTILLTSVLNFFHSKQDYKLKVNFTVVSRYLDQKGYCDLYDEKRNSIPIKSHLFYKDEVEIGDSITKKANSNLIYIYRRKMSGDFNFYVFKKINLEN